MDNYGVSTLHFDSYRPTDCIGLHDPNLLGQTSGSWPGTISNTPVVDISYKSTMTESRNNEDAVKRGAPFVLTDIHCSLIMPRFVVC